MNSNDPWGEFLKDVPEDQKEYTRNIIQNIADYLSKRQEEIYNTSHKFLIHPQQIDDFKLYVEPKFKEGIE